VGYPLLEAIDPIERERCRLSPRQPPCDGDDAVTHR
jgi:hypothetical protein